MSTIEDLDARVRAAAEDLPVAMVSRALDHLRVATDTLRWVRQESADPMGVPELSVATEHAQMAGHALRMAQDQLAAYRAAIGMGGGAAPDPGARRTAEERTDERPDVATGVRPDPATGTRRQPPADGQPAPTVRRWWSSRVAELTGGPEPAPADVPRDAIDAEELLRRITRQVGAGDRARLRAQLRGVEADVGLGLAAVAAPRLRRLADRLLGHPPRTGDLPRLRGEVDRPVRDLLPGLPPEVLDTLLSRLCRTPPPKNQPPLHPADQAVATGVLAGLLRHRLGDDPAEEDHA